MSLEGVKILRGVRITSSGTTTTDRSYIVNRMRAGLMLEVYQWRTGDGRNHYNERWKHIIFELAADELEHVVKNHPSHVSFLAIHRMLLEQGSTVTLYPDKDQSKSFEVVLFNPPKDKTIALYEDGARTDTERLQMITATKVTSGDVSWFEKNNNNYG